MKAMASSALIAINLGAGQQVVLIGRYGHNLDHLPVDARVQRHPGQQPLLGQRRVAHCHRHLAKLKPPQHGQGHKHHSEKNSQQNTAHLRCCLRCPSSYGILRPGSCSFNE